MRAGLHVVDHFKVYQLILYLSYLGTVKKFDHFINSNQQVKGYDISP